MSSREKRVLLMAATTGYQTRIFAEAAACLGVELVYATDRCDQLDDPWSDGAIPIRFHEEWRSADTVLKVAEGSPIHGVIAVGDRPTVTAAYVSRLLSLPGHPPAATIAARDKRLSRERFKAAGLLVPNFLTVPVGADPVGVIERVRFPAVVKPTVLSASRGVIRVDDGLSFATAFMRLRRLLAAPDVQELRDPEADVIQIEDYIPGDEFAFEGLLEHGELRTLAIFDKPDPLEGPFFEETIYVTPSRAGTATQRQIAASVEAAARALGLHHGPIHAECRVNSRGVFVLEVAARPIGGLCAKALRFERAGEPSPRAPEASARQIGFEEFLLRHAIGEPMADWQREAGASAVMMIPIPRSGVFRSVDGVDAASAVEHVREVLITAKPDQQLMRLPEGASYLGFIFARARTPADAEAAVRAAHAQLKFRIDPLIAVSM